MKHDEQRLPKWVQWRLRDEREKVTLLQQELERVRKTLSVRANEEIAELVESGWTPPVWLWLPPSDAEEGEVCLVWLIDPDPREPPERGLAFFGFKREGRWFDADGRDLEKTTGWTVSKVAPEPGCMDEINPATFRLLRLYLTRKPELERANNEIREETR